jgi:hypothetical protein
MTLLLREVVVTVDPLLFHDGRTHPLGDLADDAIHHLLTVEQGEVLRPAQLADVGVELIGSLHEVGQVTVGQRDPVALGELGRDLDVSLGDLVTDAPGAGVKEQPDGIVLVQAHLDEVVPGAQRSQLVGPVLGVVAGVEFRFLRQRGQFLDARLRGGHDLAVVGTCRQRDRALDLPAYLSPVGGEIVGVELRAHGDHAAADVDSDSCRHQRAQGGDHRSDGGALAQVGIRHEGQVRVDEGQAGGDLRLLAGLLVDDGSPIQQAGIDPFHEVFLASLCSGSTVLPPDPAGLGVVGRVWSVGFRSWAPDAASSARQR